MSTITEARPFAVGDKVRITNTPYPGAIPNGTVGTVAQTRYSNSPDVVFDQRMGDFPKGYEVLFFRHEIELVEEGPEPEPQEVVPNDTVVRITSSSYSSVRSGMLGTVTTKYHQHRGGCYGIELSEDTAVFGKAEAVAFYRDQFEIVEQTNTKASDLKVGDKVRMVYPERVPLYAPVLGQVGEVVPLDSPFAKEGDGMVTVKFEDDTMTCYACRLELVEKSIPGEPVEDFSTLSAGDIVNVEWSDERIQGKLYEDNGHLRISASASGIPNYEPYVVLFGLDSPRVAGAIHDVRLVEKPIPGEPVKDASTLSVGDIVNVRWQGERIQGELYEDGTALRIRATATGSRYEPNIVWADTPGAPQLAPGIHDVRLVEKGEPDWNRAERELVEADPGFKVGARVKVIKTPVSVDRPLDEIMEIEVGSTHVIADVFGDGDYKIETDVDCFWVAGACLELDTSVQVGDVVTTREQLDALPWLSIIANGSGCSVVKGGGRNRGGWMFWDGDVEDLTYVTRFTQGGDFKVIHLGVGSSR